MKYDPALYEELVENPGKVLSDASKSLELVIPANGKPLKNIPIRVVKLPRKIMVNDLGDPTRINTLVSIDGNVRKIAGIHPRIIMAAFECARCGHMQYLPQTGSKFLEPAYCDCNSEKKGVFRFYEKESTFERYQRLRLQESYEFLPAGIQPQNIEVELTEDLCGQLKAGQRVVINGILRSNQRTTRDGKSTVFDTYIQAVSVESDDSDFDKLSITPEDEAAILELSEKPDLFDEMIASIAPSIYGYEDVKLAILFLLFAGTTSILPDGTLVRGIIHVLLIGDPGIAKTKMLRYAEIVAPRATHASGKSASAVGLTAAVKKDTIEGKDDQQWTIEAGILPLADKGIAIIDEIGQIKDEDKSALHEAMESLVIHIAKAGLNAELLCRCGILAAGNPKLGRFDPFDDLTEQINMPPTLMSRFDLIFIMRDIPDPARDRKISDQILKTRYAAQLIESGRGKSDDAVRALEEIAPRIHQDLLRKYIVFARFQPSPVMSPEAWKKAQEIYLQMRNPDSMIVTARSQEGVVRMAEASARMRLSKTVDVEDVERAQKLIMVSLEQTCKDDSGKIDTDNITVGTGGVQRDRLKILKAVMLDLKHEYTAGIPVDKLREKLGEYGYKVERLDADIKKAKEIGEAWYPEEGLVLPC